MHICMRTTLNLDDDLMKALRKRAAETGRTMTELMEEALRALLAPRPAQREEREFHWVTCRGKLQPGIDLADRDSLLDAMEDRRG